MKKSAFVLTLVAAIFVCSPASSQEGQFGVIAGPSSNFVMSEDSDVQDAIDPVLLYTIGLQFDYEFHEFMGIAPELLFARRGWHSEFDVGIASGENDTRISYLELPILFRVGVPIGDVIAPKLIVGPHAALFIDGQSEGSGQFLGASSSGEDDIDSGDVNDLQFGLTAGAGVDINFGEVVMTTDIRYTRNFTEIAETPDDDSDDLYHSSWSLMLGVLY